MELQFQVKNQRLYLNTVNRVVADSQNYLTASFTFTDDWDGLPKVAQFTRGTTTVEVGINASTLKCTVPSSVLVGEGEFYVSVYGLSNDNTHVLITTNPIKIVVDASGFVANAGTISSATAQALEAHADAVESVIDNSTTGTGGHVRKLLFTVKEQTLYLTSRGKVVADSQGYLGAKFIFSDDWANTAKVAQFKKGSLFYSIMLDANGECTVPWEVLVDEGVMTVNVFGNNLQGQTNKIITVSPVDVYVEASGLTAGELPSAPTQSFDGQVLYEILSYAEAAASSAESASASATAAASSALEASTATSNLSDYVTAAANSASAAASSASSASDDATSAYNSYTGVLNTIGSYAPLASPAFTGTPTAPTPLGGDDSTKIATTAYVQAELEDYVTLTGLADDLDDYVAKTSADYIKSASVSGNTLTLTKGNDATVQFTATDPTKLSDLTNDVGYITGVSWNDVTSKPSTFEPSAHNHDGTYLKLVGGTLTGTTYATTQSADDNSTKLATTAYADRAASNAAAALADTASDVLDTLEQLSAALGDDPDFATSMATALASKADASDLDDYLPLAGGTLTGNVYTTPYYNSNLTNPDGGQTLIVSKGKTAKGTAPSSETEWHTMVMAVDSSGSTNNAHKYGQVETSVSTAGVVETRLTAYKDEANATTSASIAVGYHPTNGAYTSAPTPASGDNSTKIATTAWVTTALGGYSATSHDHNSKYMALASINSIPANADLNTYTTAGNYYCGSWSGTGDTYTNCPSVGSGFKLVVLQTNGTSYIMQIIFAYSGNIWVRGAKTTSTQQWNGWYKLANTASDITGNAATATMATTANTAKAVLLDVSGTTPAQGTPIALPLKFKNKTTGSGTPAYENYIFYALPSNATSNNNGEGIIIGSNGTTMVGAGESARNLASADTLTGGTETLYLTADSNMYLYTNCDTIADRKAAQLTTDGALILGSVGGISAANTLVIKKSNMTRGTTPSAAVSAWLPILHDSDGKVLAGVYKYITAANVSETRLYNYPNHNNTAGGAYIGVCHDASGNAYTYAPTPAAASNTTHIATTAWVRTYATPANIGASATGHTHNYAGSSSAGGAATSVAIEAGSADADRYVWFSYSGTGNEGRPVYDAAFKYNPSTNNLTVTKINGVAVGSSPKFTDTNNAVTSTSITYPSSSTNYYITASSSESTNTAGLSKFGTNARVQVTAGTASAEGLTEIILGNSTATGTAGNTTGKLCLYNDKGKYHLIVPHSGDTSNRTIYTPKSGGTLVVHTTDTAVGSASKPVYITSNGVATACTSLETAGNVVMNGTANTNYLQLPSGIKLY